MIPSTKRLIALAGFGMLLTAGVPADAGPLDPLAFNPIGPFPTAAGTYDFDTSYTLSAPVLTGPSGTLTGVFYNGIAVFDFSTITVSSGQVFGPSPFETYGAPLALLSQSNISIAGTIDVSAPTNSSQYSIGVSGPGGYGGSLNNFGIPTGPGVGADGYATLNGSGAYPGGGGFGGRGGNGGFVTSGPPTFNPSGGAPGGSPYGNLGFALQGGSGGGGLSFKDNTSIGGGGGGAIEVGAVNALTVSGSILANGSYGQGGGGSGGGIFLHGDSVALSGYLSAAGGSGGGGGGGGGEVLIEAGLGGFTGEINHIGVGGGAGGYYPLPPGLGGPPPGLSGENGDPGTITIVSAVPEPASLVLLGVGLLGALACSLAARIQRKNNCV